MPEQTAIQPIEGDAGEAQVLASYTADDGTQQTLTLGAVHYWFCDRATPLDAALFAARCQAARLNPFAGDATLVKYGNSPASVLVSKESLVKRADRMADYEGDEHGVVYADREGIVQHREGQAVYPQLGETLLGAWCRVYRAGRKPTYAEVSLAEYNTGKSLWGTKPAVMIDKVAQATALRHAYPQEMSGLYEASEIEPEGNLPTQRPMPATVPDAQTNAAPVIPAPEPSLPIVEEPAPVPAPTGPSEEDRQKLAEIAQAVGDKRAVWEAYQTGGIQAAEALRPAPAEESVYDDDVIPF